MVSTGFGMVRTDHDAADPVNALDARDWDRMVSGTQLNLASGDYGCGKGHDDTGAILQAFADLVTNGGGTIYMPRPKGGNSYNSTSAPDLTPFTANGALPYAVKGDSAVLTKWVIAGSSLADMLSVSNPSFAANGGISDYAAKWSGITIDGTGSSGGCGGLSWSDVSKPRFEDIIVQNFTTGPGWLFPNTFGWTEGVNMRCCDSNNNAQGLKYATGLGQLLGTVSTAIASGTSGITSIAVAATGGVQKAMYSGQQFIISNAAGTVTQTVTTSGTVAIGAHSIPTVAWTAAQAYSTAAQVYTGGAPSFDYWDIDLYLNMQANQDGILSDVPLGISPQAGQAMNHDGSKWRVRGNFQAGGSNTGAVFRIKGGDFFDFKHDWDLSVEKDGSGVPHTSIALDGTTAGGAGAFIGGEGLFNFANLGNATYGGGGGPYQIEVNGMVNVPGITTDPGGANQNNSPIILRGSAMTQAYDTPTPPTYSAGSEIRNTLWKDIDVVIPVTGGTGGSTIAWATKWTTGVAAPTMTPLVLAAGQTMLIPLHHLARSYVKFTVTGGAVTFGTAFSQTG